MSSAGRSLQTGAVYATEAPLEQAVLPRAHEFHCLLNRSTWISAAIVAATISPANVMSAPAQAQTAHCREICRGRGLRRVPSDAGGTLEDITPRVGNGESNAGDGARRFLRRFD